MLDTNICFALVFGSYAKGSQKPDSDLDIAFYFKHPPAGLEILDMKSKYSEYVQTEVDIVVLNNASAFLRHQVIKNGIRLFISDELKYRHFREKTMTDYDIYKYVSGMNRYD